MRRASTEDLVARDNAFRSYEVRETGGRLHEAYLKKQEVQ